LGAVSLGAPLHLCEASPETIGVRLECKACGAPAEGQKALCAVCSSEKAVAPCPTWAEEFGRAHVAQVAILTGKAWLARRFVSVYQHVTIQGKVIVITPAGDPREGFIVAARKRGASCVSPGAARGKDFTLLVCHDGFVEVQGPRKDVISG